MALKTAARSSRGLVFAGSEKAFIKFILTGVSDGTQTPLDIEVRYRV